MADGQMFKVRDKETGEVFSIREKAPVESVDISAVPTKGVQQLRSQRMTPADMIRDVLAESAQARSAASQRIATQQPMNPQQFGQNAVGAENRLKQVMGAAGSYAESIPASVALALQEKRGLTGGMQGVGRAIAGQSKDRWQDVYMNWGVPEDISFGLGIATDMLSGYGLFKAGKGLKALKNTAFGPNKTEMQNVAKQIDKGLDFARQGFKKRWEDFHGSVGMKKVDTDDVLEAIDMMDEGISNYSDIPGAAKLKNIRKKLNTMTDITVNDLHDAKLAMQDIIPQSHFRGKASTRAGRAKMSMLDEMRSMVEKEKYGGEAYKNLNKEHAMFKQHEGYIKQISHDKFGRPSDKSISRSLDSNQKEALREFNKTLPPDRQYISALKKVRRKEAIKKNIKKSAPLITGAGAAAYIGKQVKKIEGGSGGSADYGQ